ncbi:MAG: sodium:proton antiporter [Desulfobulbus sp.]|nr:sodium:proton antiporter [Desulfobulbus sp.]
MTDPHLVAFSCIFLVGAGCQWLAWQLKLPAIIFLLVSGIIAGPIWGLLNPDRLLGDLLSPFVSLSVAIILFEGSLTLNYKEILGKQSVVRNLVTVGLVVTWLITAVVSHYALGLSWSISFLFGAVSAVTGPTVIAPMLRAVRPTATIANILRWESIVIDPIGASLAVLVFECILSGGDSRAFGHILLSFCHLVGVGLLIGAAGGYLFGLFLRNFLVPGFLKIFLTLALVFTVFTGSYMLHNGAGLFAVTVMGVWLANMREVDLDEILNFKESLSVVLISLLFILLSARIDAADLTDLGWKAFLVVLAIQFLARPLNVMVSTWGSKLTWPEKHLLAWIAPRGIVAAAVSALFAIRLEQAGLAGAHHLVSLTFLVIICTVLLQSATARIIAIRLGVAEPEADGFLIVGANPLACAVGKALQSYGFRVVLADTNGSNIAMAKIDGLSTYDGNPISEDAVHHLNLAGIGRMLALSPHENMNVSAMMHYRLEFGASSVFTIRTRMAKSGRDKRTAAAILRGKMLFGPDDTYAKLAGMLTHGAEVKIERLVPTTEGSAFLPPGRHQTILLFAIDDKNQLHLAIEGKSLHLTSGWQLISLVTRDAKVEG